MANLPVHWVEARAYAHATEDEARVLRALDFALPGGPPTREVLRGHFGNPIVRLTRRHKERDAIRTAWSRWREAGIVPALSFEVEDRVDADGVLHFRLDKQRASLEALALAGDRDAIDVRVRLKAHPAKAELFLKVARELVSEVR